MKKLENSELDVDCGDKKMTEYLSKHWSCRQFLVLLFAIGATVLAYADTNFRDDYADLIKISIGGYLGQMLPKRDLD